VFEGERESGKKPSVGRCVLEERLAELAAAIDVKTIDVTTFYTIDDVCKKLQCDQKTLKRRCNDGNAPWLVSLLGLRRCPAFLFWAWVVDEVRRQLGARS